MYKLQKYLKHLSLFISLIIVFTTFSFLGFSNSLTTTNIANNMVEIGDYIQFGSYYGEPILWRVINIDEDGDPILYSERILTFKAFDTKYKDSEDSEEILDVEFYKNSTIRQWLNSKERRIDWINPEPNRDNVFNGLNPYHDEPGFLYTFTDYERNLIKPTNYTQHIIILSDKTEISISDKVFLFSFEATHYINYLGDHFITDLEIYEIVRYKKPTTRAV